jgi:hypothetical protein
MAAPEKKRTNKGQAFFCKGQIKDRHFFVDQRLFWGMIRRVGTIDASAVRGMNL